MQGGIGRTRRVTFRHEVVISANASVFPEAVGAVATIPSQ